MADTSANTIIQLSFLNLEDDTSVVVQRLSDKYMTVLNKWHEKCGTTMDVDHLDLVLETEAYTSLSLRQASSPKGTGLRPSPLGSKPTCMRGLGFGCVQCDPRDTFVIDSRDKKYNDADTCETVTLPCDEIVVAHSIHTLYCPFHYTFMNRIVTNKDTFKSEYLPMYFQQMGLNARIKQTKCFSVPNRTEAYTSLSRSQASSPKSTCLRQSDFGSKPQSYNTHKMGMDEYHTRRRELFDLDKMGIVIPKTFCLGIKTESKSCTTSLDEKYQDKDVSTEGPYTEYSRQSGMKQPWYNGTFVKKAGDFRGMQQESEQESEQESSNTVKTSPVPCQEENVSLETFHRSISVETFLRDSASGAFPYATPRLEPASGPKSMSDSGSSSWSSYVQSAVSAMASVPISINYSLPSLMAYNTVDYTGTPYSSSNLSCNHVVHVILNYHEYSVLVLTHSLTEDEQNVLDHYQEYGFVKLFTYYAKTKTVCDKIARMFVDETSTISPVTVGIINKQMELAAQYVVLFGLVDDTECTDFDTEEQRIIEFIRENYVIDHTIEHRMKASAIFTICTGFLQPVDQNEVNMRKRISTYLKKMNLQKKRYNDGYYYYGIREKTAEELHSNIKKDIPSDTTYHPDI